MLINVSHPILTTVFLCDSHTYIVAERWLKLPVIQSYLSRKIPVSIERLPCCWVHFTQCVGYVLTVTH